ncbi:cobalamin-dependent protein, partial [bacterium]|nr:cobalamin-dependent protein [bacterium]
MAKTDCLLIHVPQVRGFSKKDFKLFINYIAIGVFSMCNELAKNKFKPQIIHLGVEKSFDADFDIADYVKKNKIKMVGLSLHWHYQAYDTLNVARKIKEINPDTFIFLGGIMSSAFADDIIKKYSYIDAVIKGEGEKSIVELAQKIHSQDKNLSSVSNLR